jgi:hypothetical protein
MTRTSSEAIDSYVTDMLALEEHILTAVQGQQKDLRDGHTAFAGVLRDVEAKANRHVNELKALVDGRDIGAGSKFSEVVKKAGSAVLGAGAAAIDFVRTERVPKNLRDDYTALALAVVGYAMLFTTAKALGDEPVAALASAHHKDYANASMTLQHAAPASVIALLEEEGLTADPGVLESVYTELDKHWRDGAKSSGAKSGRARSTSAKKS